MRLVTAMSNIVENPTYQDILQAILVAVGQMRRKDEIAVKACLWQAGVHPDGFHPDYWTEYGYE